MTSAPTAAEILAWPVVVPWWPDAARALGYGQHSAYEAARDGSAPVPVLRRGRRLVVLRSALLEALGIEDRAPETSEAGAPPPATATTVIDTARTATGGPDGHRVPRLRRVG